MTQPIIQPLRSCNFEIQKQNIKFTALCLVGLDWMLWFDIIASIYNQLWIKSLWWWLHYEAMHGEENETITRWVNNLATKQLNLEVCDVSNDIHTYISAFHPWFGFPWVREGTSGVETGSALSKWPWPAIATTAACPRLHWGRLAPILWARGRWTRTQEACERKFLLWRKDPWGAIWALESDATRIVAIAWGSRTKRGGRKVPGFRV